MTGMARILCVDDEPAVLTSLQKVLEWAGHTVVAAPNAGAALHLLGQERFDLVMSDYQMPGIDGLEFLRMLRAERDDTPVIMLTGYASIDHAMEAIRAGANDYLVKPYDPANLSHRIGQVLALAQARRELEELRAAIAEERGARRILGNAPMLRRALDLVAAAARSRATVLLEGESGTGKELFAREIHERSDRRGKPFIRLNCAALPEGLIESALFGHEKGAFTGAIKRVEGAFERADGGTLLLDEISEMRVDLQAKLLRVLQEQEFERVGGSATVTVDVRVIATTNRDLRAEVERGHFRRDLFYRLNVVPILVPPLRDRIVDVPALALHFASRFAAENGKRVDGITPEATELLQRYTWPGNVRELQHAVERAVLLTDRSTLDASAFDTVRNGLAPSQPVAAAPDASPGAITLPTLDIAAAEAALIARALEVTNNNRTHAAALLGLGVRTLRKKWTAPASDPDAEATA